MAVVHTTNLNLNKPTKGTVNWNTYYNDNMDVLDNGYGTLVGSSNEVTNSRKDNINNTTYNTLGARLDNQSSQLADKANNEDVQNITTQTDKYKTITKAQNNQTTYIIATGDSVTYSVKPHPSSDQVTNPYPALLQTKLRQIYNNNNITVENQGIPGISAGGWLSGTQYNDKVLSKNPDMIILMLGINDIQSGNDLKTYESNMTQLIVQALNNNIEVILMTEPMIMVKNDWVASGNVQDVNSFNYMYAKICYKLAEKYHIGFIDLQQEFIDLFYKSNVYLPSDLINTTDFVHPTDLGYEMISDIVIKNFKQRPVMIIDNPKIIPVVGCPFVESNIKISGIGSANYLRFSNCYVIFSADYVKVRFLVLQKNISLSIIHPISYQGGQMDIMLDGTKVTTLSQYDANIGADASYVHYTIKTNIVDNLNIGYHELLFSGTNLTKVGTQSTYYFALEGLLFEYNNISNNILKDTILNISANTFVPLPSTKDLICLKNNKIMAVLCKGYFQNKFGINIFDSTSGSIKQVSNSISFLNNKIQLTTYDINTSNPAITIGTDTLDLTKELDIRIEIDFNHNIKVYVNNVLEISATNTQNSIKGGILELANFDTTNSIIVSIDKLSCCYY